MRRSFLLVVSFFFAATAAQARIAGDIRPALIRPGGLPVFFSSSGPLAYRGLAQSEIPKDAVPIGHVTGKSCQFSLAVPLTATFRATSVSGAIGNGTYNIILERMAQEHPGLRGIYDAKVDLHFTSMIVGIFGRLCTEIDAEGYR
jgi:hypothetical protein